MQKFRTIKKEVRIVAWDDGPFSARSGRDIIVGVIFRGGQFMDGLLRTDVEIDGLDATDRIIESVNKSKHKDLRVMMLDGITFAGFNTVDIKEIYQKTKLSVIAISRKMPNMEKFMAALRNLPDYEMRERCVKSAGKIYCSNVKNKKVYFQIHGISKEDAEKVIAMTTALGLIPEPLRVAHLIATGVVLGESIGHA